MKKTAARAAPAIRAPRGTRLACRNWQIEAAYRMIQNNLDPDVAFDPGNLIVYGGRGRAARNWACYDAILASLKALASQDRISVLSTPSMIQLMEMACLASAAPHLDEGETTVGTHVCVSHVAAAEAGEVVSVNVRLVDVVKRRLTYEVSARVGDRLSTQDDEGPVD